MPRRLRGLGPRFAAPALVLFGCELRTGPCTTSVEPAIVVSVVDALSGEPRAAEARGAVHDGTYVDSLRPYGSSGSGVLLSRAAAFERPGLYTVRVEHAGYAPWEAPGIRVRDDECHVRTVELTAELEEAPSAW